MINKWIGIGNLTRDPEIRTTQSGISVASFSIACNEKFKDQSGELQEKVEYVNIVAWKHLADLASQYLEKGKRVYIEGKLQTRKYTDQNDNERHITEIVAREIKFL